MAQKKPVALVERKACERVMFGVGRARRFTQDSPVLPDVWIKFAEDLDVKRELLLTPFAEARPGEVRRVVERAARPRSHDGRRAARADLQPIDRSGHGHVRRAGARDPADDVLVVEHAVAARRQEARPHQSRRAAAGRRIVERPPWLSRIRNGARPSSACRRICCGSSASSASSRWRSKSAGIARIVSSSRWSRISKSPVSPAKERAALRLEPRGRGRRRIAEGSRRRTRKCSRASGR
jgi:hypothetical protein